MWISQPQQTIVAKLLHKLTQLQQHSVEVSFIPKNYMGFIPISRWRLCISSHIIWALWNLLDANESGMNRGAVS